MKLYALREINTGLYYSRRRKDICELGADTLFISEEIRALHYRMDEFAHKLSEPVWYTALSAIEKMYDKPILEVDGITEDMIKDTASLFKFKVVPIEVKEV